MLQTTVDEFFVQREQDRVIIRWLASMPPYKKINATTSCNALSVPLVLGLRDWRLYSFFAESI